MKRNKTKLGGKKITREEAYEGLDDPSTWPEFEKRIKKEFNRTPLIGKCRCHSMDKSCPIHGHMIR